MVMGPVRPTVAGCLDYIGFGLFMDNLVNEFVASKFVTNGCVANGCVTDKYVAKKFV